MQIMQKTLPPIGNKRKNGTFKHNDWEYREYHKKCFKEACAERKLIFFINNMNNKYGTEVPFVEFIDLVYRK